MLFVFVDCLSPLFSQFTRLHDGLVIGLHSKMLIATPALPSFFLHSFFFFFFLFIFCFGCRWWWYKFFKPGFSGGGGGTDSTDGLCVSWYGAGGGGGSFSLGERTVFTPGSSRSAAREEGSVLIELVTNYAETNVTTFDTCGANGARGPTAAQCSARDFIRRNLNATMPVTVTSGGVQQFRIPNSGFYRFTAFGAAGGFGGALGPLSVSTVGGRGAVVASTVYLVKNTLINMVIGQSGTYRSTCCRGPDTLGGGGGGGTFVWVDKTQFPIVAAAGGGGSPSIITANYICASGADTDDPRFLNSTCVATSLPNINAGFAGSGGVSSSASQLFGGPGAGWIGKGSYSVVTSYSGYAGATAPGFMGGSTLPTAGRFEGMCLFFFFFVCVCVCVCVCERV